MRKYSASGYRLEHLRKVLGDRYDFESYLGHGAFASVYLAKNRRLERREALKVMSEMHDDDSRFARRFVEEAKLVASLDHPNIVQVYDYGEVDGIIWYAMQYVDGPNLRAEFAARKLFETGAVIQLAIPILDALDYSHRQGIIHRDIKPSNVILSQRGRPYVMDFGIAKSARSALKTMTGSVLGTPAYMSPEQMSGHELDGRSDLYSLGLALYEMLAGQPAYPAGDPLAGMLKRLKEDPPPLAEVRHGIDPKLADIVMRSLARESSQRFTDADEMRRALIAVGGDGWDTERMMPLAKPPQKKRLEKGTILLEGASRQHAPSQTASQQPTPPEAQLAALDDTIVTQGLQLAFEKAGSADQRQADSAPRQRRWWTLAALVLIASLSIFGIWRLGLTPTAPAAEAETDPSADKPPAISMLPPPQTDPGSPQSTPSAAAATPAQRSDAEEPMLQDSASEIQPVDTAAGEIPPAPADDRSAPLTRKKPRPSEPAPMRRPVRPPRVLERVAPTLSSEDAAACAGERIVLSVRVDQDGHATGSRVLVGNVERCAEIAQTAAQQYLFEAARDLEGLPIASSATLSLEFDEVEP